MHKAQWMAHIAEEVERCIHFFEYNDKRHFLMKQSDLLLRELDDKLLSSLPLWM